MTKQQKACPDWVFNYVCRGLEKWDNVLQPVFGQMHVNRNSGLRNLMYGLATELVIDCANSK